MTTLFGASSSSSSPAPSNSWTYDVFLSFRGEDTRHTFTQHLNNSLVRKGVRTFIDDELRRGEEISAALIRAIEESKLSVLVFSENYASSKWCLEELVKILQCKAWKKQMVYPIFYKVDPSDIRKQTGSFGEALAKHECEFKDQKDECKFKDKMEKLQRWRNALTEAGNLSGRHLSDGYEAEFIYEIVEDISTQVLKLTPLHVANNPVGIQSRLQYILELLDVGRSHVQMVGIWGIGGIGKTTIAKAVYNSITHKFDGSCFLANVREESSTPGGLVKLQNIILSKIVGGNGLNVNNADEGINVLKERLSHKRVLLILDDVNHLDQLNKLAGGYDWFGSGSRVVITTRDKHCLTANEVHSIYEVVELNYQESLQLFNFYAFKNNKHMDDFVQLAANVVLYAKGIPLVLKVLGADLYGRSMEEWQDALKDYKRSPKQEIQETFKRSYNALGDSMKEIFLHIACFFKGKKLSYVMDILQGCDLNPKYCIKVLTEKALISIVEDNNIWMHDLLEDMGKEIVRQESPKLGERSRLWLEEDVCDVLEKNTGTSKVKGIMIPYKLKDFPKRIRLTGESFKEMKNLQILIVDNDIFVGGPVDYLSNKLTVLHWRFCPLLSLPSEFDPQKLAIFNMNTSRTLFQGDELKIMRHLKSLTLRFCHGLTRIPDLSGLTNLVEMDLGCCYSLVEVHNSVGGLGKLVNLDLGLCLELRIFQTTINLKSLVTLDLRNCPLEFFPEIEREMKSLESLCLFDTAIKQLPSSVGYLTSLENLKLDHCENLTYLPWSIFYNLQHLQFVDLKNCPELVTFPTESESLPPWLNTTNSASLHVNLTECHKLREISAFPREIDYLLVRGCASLERISKLSKILEDKESNMMRFMDLSNCHRLCNNLVRDVAKMETKLPLSSSSSSSLDNLGELAAATQQLMEVEAHEKLKALLTLFLSCRESEFQVVFPASASVPNWFTCRKDLNGSDIDGYEFCIEIPQYFKWENKGLALCAQTKKDITAFFLDLKIYINDIFIYNHYKNEEDYYEFYRWVLDDLEGGHVWVYYIPFITFIESVDESGYMCRIRFECIAGINSCGVHVLMAKDDEQVSMEVVVHQDKNKRLYFGSEFWEDDEEDSDDQESEDTEGLDDDEEEDWEDNEGLDDEEDSDLGDHQQEPTNLGKRKADDISQPIT